jgi:hypothetical protein
VAAAFLICNRTDGSLLRTVFRIPTADYSIRTHSYRGRQRGRRKSDKIA